MARNGDNADEARSALMFALGPGYAAVAYRKTQKTQAKRHRGRRSTRPAGGMYSPHP